MKKCTCAVRLESATSHKESLPELKRGGWGGGERGEKVQRVDLFININKLLLLN